jgi:hypothetical protein
VHSSAKPLLNAIDTPVVVDFETDESAFLLTSNDSTIKGIVTWDMTEKAYDRNAKECRCVSEFGLCQCVGETFPVDEMNVHDIFTSCQCLLDALRSSEFVDWDSLSPSHKRWCLYWWYAVNIFGVRGERRPLPNCIVNTVRQAYPNINGDAFTGFKASVERANGKENKSNKRMKHEE